MKKVFAGSFVAAGMIVVVVSMALAVSCEGRYANAVRVIENQMGIMNRFSQSVERSSDAGQVAAAIREFNQAMAGLIPEARRVQQEYPELSDPQNLPPEVVANFEKLALAATRFEAAMTRARQYSDDPGVMAALAEFASVMGVSVPDASGDLRAFSIP